MIKVRQPLAKQPIPLGAGGGVCMMGGASIGGDNYRGKTSFERDFLCEKDVVVSALFS